MPERLLTPWVDQFERSCVARSLADFSAARFAWGLEHLGVQGDDPLVALRRWARRLDSDAWFDQRVGPPADFELAPPSRSYLGLPTPDGWTTLRFRSAHKGLDPVNDTVVCRFSPGRRRRAPVVVVLPHWGAELDEFAPFGRILQGIGLATLVVALPYHDARMPTSMRHPDPVCCANIGLNLAAIRQSVTDVRRAIDWVERRGAEARLAGVSFGGAVGQIVSALDRRVRRAAITFPCATLADFVWGSALTRPVREAMEGRIAREDIRAVWAPISPLTYLPRLGSRAVDHMLITGARDRVVTAEMSGAVIARYRQLRIRHRWRRYSCGHYSIGRLPFSVRWSWDLVAALR